MPPRKQARSAAANTPSHFQELHSVKPSQVLRDGADTLEDRADMYDSPEGERSMQATVTAFNAIYNKDLTEEQGWQFMSLLKKSRSAKNNQVLDNYVDDCAYSALAAEAAGKDGDQ